MTNLDIYNPTKVRGIVEALEARVDHLQQENERLKAAVKRSWEYYDHIDDRYLCFHCEDFICDKQDHAPDCVVRGL